MLTALLVVALLGAVALIAWLAWQLRGERRARIARDAQLAQWQTRMGDGAARLTRPSRGLPTPVIVGDSVDPMADVLRLVRDALGAREVTYWRRASQGGLAPSASSLGSAVPSADGAAPHAQWSDAEGLVSVVDTEAGPLLVGPVPAQEGADTRGALVARGAPGWPTDKADAKRRMAECGEAVARVQLLLDAQRSAAEYSNGIMRVLDVSKDFNAARDPERLAELVCETAIALFGMARGAIVRWDPAHAAGHVAAVAIGHPVEPGQAVDPLSAAGEACAEVRTVLWQDATRAREGYGIFSPTEPHWPTGAVLAVPLVRSRAVFGALVVETDRAGAIREQPLRMVSLLAELVMPSLESLWNYEAVERRARTDPLTGLWNRRHFEEELAKVVLQAERYTKPLSVIMVDVDHFKRVNDTHGHDAGDRVLRHVATLLRDSARNVDLVARLGGEEFVLLLPETPATGGAEFAERLRRTLEATPAPLGDGHTVPVTASFGVVGYPAPGLTASRVVAAADAALYAAKRDGRNRVALA